LHHLANKQVNCFIHAMALREKPKGYDTIGACTIV
jgi:hypothetical protein